MRRLEMNVPMFTVVRAARGVVRFLMRMNVREVFRDAHQIEVPVMHPALGTNRIRQGRHNGRCSPEHHRFEAVLMVKLQVHCRNHDIVMIVLQTGKPLDQFTLAKSIHVTEIRDAMLCLGGLLLVALKLGAQHIAHCFATGFVTTLSDPGIELLGQFVLK